MFAGGSRDLRTSSLALLLLPTSLVLLQLPGEREDCGSVMLVKGSAVWLTSSRTRLEQTEGRIASEEEGGRARRHFVAKSDGPLYTRQKPPGLPSCARTGIILRPKQRREITLWHRPRRSSWTISSSALSTWSSRCRDAGTAPCPLGR